MPSNQVRAQSVLAGAIRAEFVGAYRKNYTGIKERLSPFFEFDIPSTRRRELFAYFKAAPYPQRVERGDEIPSDTFDSEDFEVENLDWGLGVEWHQNDEDDDQTRSLVERGRDVGVNFATLDERVGIQILAGTADPTLLKSIPNAPDGADMFNATDGAGADRFGVSGGNIESGATLTTGAGIRTAIFAARARMLGFQDTEGQPLWNESLIDKGLTVLYSTDQEELVAEALIQGRTLHVSGNGGGAVTNVILEAGHKITRIATPRLSGSTMYVVADGAPHKPIFTLARKPLQEIPLGPENSAEMAKKLERGLMWHMRRGYGVFLPYQIVQVTA